MKMGLVLLTIFMATMTCTRVYAQTSCTTALISMSPCLNYITGNTTTPGQQCCRQLDNVVKTSPDCLCQVLNGGGSQLGFNVNQTQALALPRACNVQTPPVSQCNNGGGSTSDSPSESPNSSGPGNNGSKTVPVGEGDGPSSSGSSIKFSFPLVAFLSVASYIAIFHKH